MSAGRCAGCGAVHTSHRVIIGHVVSCPQYTALYRTEPARCLDPEAEYRRWKRDEDTREHRAAARAVTAQARFRDRDEQKLAQDARWATPRDLLED